jgi:hypothetical protein
MLSVLCEVVADNKTNNRGKTFWYLKTATRLMRTYIDCRGWSRIFYPGMISGMRWSTFILLMTRVLAKRKRQFGGL